MNKPEFSPLSVDDLREILVYISRDKPQAAERFVAKLKDKCYFLAQTPEAGSKRDDLSQVCAAERLETAG